MGPLHARCRRITAALLIAFLPATGCSWALVQKPPPGRVEAAPTVECTSSVASPVADTTGAVLFGAAGIVIFSSSGTSCRQGEICFRDAVIGGGLASIGVATALMVSAAYGYRTTAECRELERTQLACVSGVEAACRSLKDRKPKPAEPSAPVPDVPP